MSVPAPVTAGVTLEIHIAASTATVWRSLTESIGEWWPGEFFIGGEEGKRSYHLEAKPGGRMYEEWESGGGLLWAQVSTVIPETMLQITGHCFPQWGGPSISYGTWQLAAEGEGCKLSFDEQTLGRVPENNVAEKQKGWDFLMETMKAHIEGNAKPAWEG